MEKDGVGAGETASDVQGRLSENVTFEPRPRGGEGTTG